MSFDPLDPLDTRGQGASDPQPAGSAAAHWEAFDEILRSMQRAGLAQEFATMPLDGNSPQTPADFESLAAVLGECLPVLEAGFQAEMEARWIPSSPLSDADADPSDSLGCDLDPGRTNVTAECCFESLVRDSEKCSEAGQ